jgi:uncharacterized membrane protein YhaH (DUF805 family)
VVLYILTGIVIHIQSTKRAHDIGKSGWILLIPFYNLIVFFKKGEPESNIYGPSPEADFRYASNIIYDQKKTSSISSEIATWSGFLFYLITLIFCIWKLVDILNSLPTRQPKPPINDPPIVYNLDSATKIPDSVKVVTPDKTNQKYVIKASSINELRQKIKTETAGIQIDLSSVQLNANNNSLTYSEGSTVVIGLALIWDPSRKSLKNRINTIVTPRNLPNRTKVLVDSKYSNGLYHTIVAIY